MKHTMIDMKMTEIQRPMYQKKFNSIPDKPDDHVEISQKKKFVLGRCSEQGFPSDLAAFLDQALHLLRARTRGDEERVWHVDNNQIVDAETGD